jgi:hypothetical protein
MKRVNGAIIRECNKRTMKCFLLFRQHTILGVTLYLSIICVFLVPLVAGSDGFSGSEF